MADASEIVFDRDVRIATEKRLDLARVVYGTLSTRPIGGDKLSFVKCILFSEYFSDEVCLGERVRKFSVGADVMWCRS
jgi:hypothetical protein